MNLFELDHDMRATLGMFAFWIVIAALVIATSKDKTKEPHRHIAVGSCLKPKAKPKFHDGDIMRGSEYVE